MDIISQIAQEEAKRRIRLYRMIYNVLNVIIIFLVILFLVSVIFHFSVLSTAIQLVIGGGLVLVRQIAKEAAEPEQERLNAIKEKRDTN